MRRLFAALIVLITLVASPAFAEKRVALVIGNSAYQNVPRLDNPSRDATAITKLLQDAKFDIVESRRDLGIVEMRRALRDFFDKARDADMAVVYFAGHGIEVEGSNYLIPTDAVLERDRDAYDEAIALDRLLQTVEPAKQLRLVILDACRDNPFDRKMRKTLASRSVGRGLAAIEPPKTNTLIAFAAKSGSTAQDGAGANSPFTAALLKHLTTPGLDLRKAFGMVRDEVMSDTGDRQEPFVYGSLGGKDVSLVPPAPAPKVAPPPAPVVDTQADMRRDYEFTQQLGTKDGWTFFLQQYPTGFYANLARGQLAKIDAEDQRQVAAERARTAEAERARLASENARAEEQARAAREAKAAETARLAAEKLKVAEQKKAEEAERQRQAMERVAAERLARDAKAAEDARVAAEKKAAEQARIDDAKKVADADRVERAKADEDARKARDAKAAEDARIAADKKAADATAKADAEARTKIAALPAQTATQEPTLSVSRQLQTELRRLGCYDASIGDEWSPAAKRALDDFSKRERMTLDSAVASTTALDIVRAKSGKVCALACGPRDEERGGQCVRKTCAKGKILDQDGDCVAKDVPHRAPKVAAPAPRPVRERVVRSKPQPVADAAPRAPRASSGGGGGRCFNFSGRSYCE